MTLMVCEHRTCGHCGKRTRYMESLGGAASGDIALDFRLSTIVGEAPPSDMSHRCEHCGYCWPDLRARSDPRTQDVLDSPAYRQLLADASLPEVVGSLRAQALLQRELGQWAGAALSMLGAAWAMDDAGHSRARQLSPAGRDDADLPSPVQLARSFREQALADLDQAHGRGQSIQADPARDEVMRVDMLRRCGRFDAAAQLAGQLLSPDRGQRWDVRLADGLQLGRQLALEGSTRCATFREAAELRRRLGGWPLAAAAALSAPGEGVDIAIDIEGPVGLAPRHLLGRLRADLMPPAPGGPRRAPPGPARQPSLPLPADLAAELQRLSWQNGWPVGVTMAAFACAMLELLPELAGQDPQLERLLAEACADAPEMRRFCLHAMRGSSADRWSWNTDAAAADNAEQAGPFVPDGAVDAPDRATREEAPA